MLALQSFESDSKVMTEILYQDNQVTVYKELIVINKYYFPLATSKTILFSDIHSVALHSSEGVTHRWGVSAKYLNNWFPYDANRKNKTKFIEIVFKGRRIKPSITPDDPDKVFQIIWEHYTPEGKEYSQRMSQQMGKETEVAQQQIMQREGQTSQVVLSAKQKEQQVQKS